MDSALLLDRLGAVCKKFGPGRLPHADRRDIGAGYAGAATALGVVVLFAVLSLALDAVSTLLDGEGAVYATAALLSLLIVVPVAFLIGVVVARLVPMTVPFSGAILGILGTIGTYLVSFVVLFIYGLVAGVASGTGAVVTNAFYVMATYGSVGFVLTCWLTLPVGCVNGFVYERVGHPT